MQPVSEQMTTAQHFFLLQTQSARGLVSPRCDEGKRESGSMCPMTAYGARQMSMFSRQLFKAMQ